MHACTHATCGRTCACKKTYKTGVQSVFARTFLSWSHQSATTHFAHFSKMVDIPDFDTK